MKKFVFSRQCDSDKDIVSLWYYWYRNIYKADKIVIFPVCVKGSTTVDWVKNFYKNKDVDIHEKSFDRWFSQDVYNHQHKIINKYISEIKDSKYTILYADSDEFFEPVPDEILSVREYVSYTQARLATLGEISLNNVKSVNIFDINKNNKNLVDPHSEPRTLYINNYDIKKYPLVCRTNNMKASGFYFYHFHFRGLEWCKNKFKNMKYISNAPGSSFHWKKYTNIFLNNTEDEIEKEYDKLKQSLVKSKMENQFKSYFKKVDIEFSGEFGYELLGVIPYAYYLHKNNLLGKTKSKADMEPFYYFSKEHETLPGKRIWVNIENFPAKTPHFKDIPKYLWEMPPYKEIYKNNEITFKKPICIIGNKYTVEWVSIGHPVNFIDIATLEKIINKLKDKYQIIYCRTTKSEVVQDRGKEESFNDFDIVKKYPEVITVQDLYRKYNYKSFNEFQLKLFANADRFITVQGGYAVLGSLFGKPNLIFAKRGSEFDGNLYNKWYGKLSGSQITHVKTLEELVEKA